MDLIVKRDGAEWRARSGARDWRCAVGRSGIVPEADKREGDGATPIGCYTLRYALFRPDRLSTLETGLPTKALKPDDGWCEDPADPNYNRPVKLSPKANHDRLWRDDNLYDVIVVISHNDDPPVPGMGSAIFLHVARPGYSPTQGCVALAMPDLLDFLKDADTTTRLCVASD